MKKLYFLLPAMLCFFAAQSQVVRNWTDTFPFPQQVNGEIMTSGAPLFDASGNIYFAGSETDDSSMFFVKTDPAGNILWKKYYNRPQSMGYQSPMDMKMDASGNIIICVSDLSVTTDMDITLLKYDQNGNRLWTYTYSTALWEFPAQFLVDNAGNSYVSFYQDNSLPQFRLLKVNASGQFVRDSCISGTGWQGYWIMGTTAAPNGGFVVNGSYYDQASQLHSVLISCDSTFHVNWLRDSINYNIQTVAIDAAGNITTAGNDSIANWAGPLRLKKYDPAGNLIWSQAYPSFGFNAASYSMICDNASNVYFCLNTDVNNLPDGYAVKFNSSGSLVWSYQVPNPGWTCEIGKNIRMLNDGTLAFAAEKEIGSSYQHWNCYEITRLDPAGNALGAGSYTYTNFLQMVCGIPGASPYDGALAVLTRMQVTHTFQLSKFCYSGDCKPNIGGTVYIDANTDCSAGSGEVRIPGRVISLDNGQSYSMTNTYGNYTFYELPGTYSLTEYLPPYYQESCPGPLTPTLATASDSSMHNDFGNTVTPNVTDLAVYATISPVHAGFGQNAILHYENHGTTTENAVVSLDLDPIFNFQSALPAPSLVSGPHYEWNVSSLAPMAGGNIAVFTNVNSSVANQTAFTNTVQITPSPGTDVFATDNTALDSGVVSGSFDPNFKTVEPAGLIPQSDSVLTYTIYFQNTGTDTAFTVSIVDTLSGNLDLLPLHVLCASHPVTTTVYGRTVRFTFSNILLPDSTTNEMRSHGFVCFSVEQKPNLAVGTIIPNTAQIYFDFNAPVATNNAADTIAGPASVHSVSAEHLFSVYPNPASDKVQLNLDNRACTATIRISDVTGKTIREQKLDYVPGQSSLSLENMAPGVYFLEVKTAEVSETIRLVKQ